MLSSLAISNSDTFWTYNWYVYYILEVRKSGSTEKYGHYTLSIWQHSNEQQNFTNLN